MSKIWLPLLVLISVIGFVRGDATTDIAEKVVNEKIQLLSEKAQAELQKHINEGKSLFKEKKFQEAIKEFEAALAIDPSNEEAARYLEKARLEAKRAEISSLMAAGKKLLAEGQYDNAAEEFQKILEIEPENRQALRYLKEVEKRRAKPPVERKEAPEAERIKTEREKALEGFIQKGQELFDKGEYDQAILEWERVLATTAPKDPYFERAQLLIRKAKEESLRREKERLEKVKRLEQEKLLLEAERQWAYTPTEKKAPGVVIERKKKAPISEELARKLQKPVTISAQNKLITDVLSELAESAGINIVVDDRVRDGTYFEDNNLSPNVTAYLKDISFIEALELILRAKGLKYKFEGNIVRISTVEAEEEEELQTKVYHLTTGLSTIEDIIMNTVPGFREGRSDYMVQVIPGTGTVIVRTTPDNLALIDEIVSALDVQPLQVMIEAKFVEVSGTDSFSIGSAWAVDNYLNTDRDISARGTFNVGIFEAETETEGESGVTLESEGALPSEGVGFSIRKLTDTEFSAIIRALSTLGRVNVLSAPKVVALNNQRARISVATTYHFVESYEVRETTTEVRGSEMRLSTLRADEVAERPVGISLDVIPSISPNRRVITLTITPEASEFVGWSTPADLGLVNLPPGVTFKAPVFSVRRVQTRVAVEDGETVILGGLITGTRSESVKGVPLLSRIPVLGALFRVKDTADVKRNLIIFVTAHLLTPEGVRYHQ